MRPVSPFLCWILIIHWGASAVAEEPNTLTESEQAAGWRLLFDGRTLNGWQASDASGSFNVHDGAIIAEGPRSHLYFVGEMSQQGFRNFELSLEVMTAAGANSGLYFHTAFQEAGWPSAGYEVQISNSDPPGQAVTGDPSRTGGLWGVVNVSKAPVEDGKWFTLTVKVEGKRITTLVDDTVVVDYLEPAVVNRPANLAGKVLSNGTFALQASSETSRALFRSIKIRALDRENSSVAPGMEETTAVLDREAVSGKTFRMHWVRGQDVGVLCELTLRTDGRIDGAPSENETTWELSDSGHLVFLGSSGRVTSEFTSFSRVDGQWFLAGNSKAFEGLGFRLDEKLNFPLTLDDASINEMIRPWSKQTIVGMNSGESYDFELNNGGRHTIKLVKVAETRDSVVTLVRKAEVLVEIDGNPLLLTCAPYVMPTEYGDLRIQADITSGMVESMTKEVSFSLWHAEDPIVDTQAFRYPLVDHRLFSHELQAYGEVVWLGIYDGDPRGVVGRHAYGIDLSGFENGPEVAAVADGVVHDVYPSTENPYAALIRSENGVVWEYGHLNSLLPEVREGVSIKAGQVIGRLGKRGGSGNFAHLHLGAHPSPAHRTAVVRTQRLNFFPWIVTAYRARYPQALFAIPGAHQVIRAGETCRFDASHSLCFGSKIVRYQWRFPDGERYDGAVAEKTFSEPGVYQVELAIQDAEGREDLSFSRVKVYPGGDSVTGIPTIVLTHIPTMGIRPGQPVTFRGWVQAEGDASMRLDFGDGTVLENYASYEEVTHVFDQPGIHVVTAEATIEGMPVTQKQKVLVTGNLELDSKDPAGESSTGGVNGSRNSTVSGSVQSWTKGSGVKGITIGAGRDASGLLINPNKPLPEGLPTLSANVELVQLARGEKVEVWLEQGENRTGAIEAAIEGEGDGEIPVDLHLEDTPFPPGNYTFVVMINGKKRFTQEFRIVAP